MMTLEIDDETAGVLNELALQQHVSPAQLIKTALREYLEDCQDAKHAEAAYLRYLDSGKIAHNLDDVVKALTHTATGGARDLQVLLDVEEWLQKKGARHSKLARHLCRVLWHFISKCDKIATFLKYGNFKNIATY